jgi:hypothetical protein
MEVPARATSLACSNSIVHSGIEGTFSTWEALLVVVGAHGNIVMRSAHVRGATGTILVQ